ncbi:MAG: hypothetical protein IJQ52_05840 [Bacteroidales bacterium]|nr:hypothetical protein [Bacteroidales bacterium]
MKIMINTILMFVLLASVSCEKDYTSITNPDRGGKSAKSYEKYDIIWSEAADSCTTAFIDRFFCDEPRNGSRRGVFSYSEYNRRGGNFNCYWQQAHAMAVMVDYYNRVKATRPDTAAILEDYFTRWFDSRANNYEGNPGYYGSTGFGNNFTDDTSWITIALLQLFEATGEQKYFNAAKQTWDECVRPRFELHPYRWLPWKWTDLRANECTNGPGAIVAATLAGYAREAGDEAAFQQYLDEAYRCFDQNMDVMNPNGTLGITPLSYTQGTCMEAGRLIWHLTGDDGYLRKAISAARGQMANVMNDIYEHELVMRNEGTDENNSIFHAVLLHWAARMVTDHDIDVYDSTIRKELYNYLRRHAAIYWTIGIDKSKVAWSDSYFGTRCYQARAVGTGGSLGAFTGGAQAIESMCIIENETF